MSLALRNLQTPQPRVHAHRVTRLGVEAGIFLTFPSQKCRCDSCGLSRLSRLRTVTPSRLQCSCSGISRSLDESPCHLTGRSSPLPLTRSHRRTLRPQPCLGSRSGSSAHARPCAVRAREHTGMTATLGVCVTARLLSKGTLVANTVATRTHNKGTQQ